MAPKPNQFIRGSISTAAVTHNLDNSSSSGNKEKDNSRSSSPTKSTQNGTRKIAPSQNDDTTRTTTSSSTEDIKEDLQEALNRGRKHMAKHDSMELATAIASIFEHLGKEEGTLFLNHQFCQWESIADERRQKKKKRSNNDKTLSLYLAIPKQCHRNTTTAHNNSHDNNTITSGHKAIVVGLMDDQDLNALPYQTKDDQTMREILGDIQEFANTIISPFDNPILLEGASHSVTRTRTSRHLSCVTPEKAISSTATSCGTPETTESSAASTPSSHSSSSDHGYKRNDPGFQTSAAAILTPTNSTIDPFTVTTRPLHDDTLQDTCASNGTVNHNRQYYNYNYKYHNATMNNERDNINGTGADTTTTTTTTTIDDVTRQTVDRWISDQADESIKVHTTKHRAKDKLLNVMNIMMNGILASACDLVMGHYQYQHPTNGNQNHRPELDFDKIMLWIQEGGLANNNVNHQNNDNTTMVAVNYQVLLNDLVGYEEARKTIAQFRVLLDTIRSLGEDEEEAQLLLSKISEFANGWYKDVQEEDSLPFSSFSEEEENDAYNCKDDMFSEPLRMPQDDNDADIGNDVMVTGHNDFRFHEESLIVFTAPL